MRRRAGFSLVELLIVVAIIGIVAAIAIPGLIAARRTSNESATVANLRNIGSAEATYYANKGSYGSFASLTALQIIDSEWTDGVNRDNYTYSEVGWSGNTFEFSAVPFGGDTTNGTRSFNLIEDMVVRQSNGLSAPTRSAGVAIGVQQ